VYGQDGPYRERPGLDRNGIALGGLLHITGYPDAPPVRPGVIMADYLTALFNTIGILAALVDRARTDKGQQVEVALYESVLRVMEWTVAAYDRLGVVMGRIGNRIAYSAPRNAYRTSDGRWVGVSGTAQSVAERVFRAIGRPELIDDPRFATNNDRLEHIDDLDRVIGDWIGSHTLDEVMEAFEREDAAAAPIYDAGQIVEDPQYRARGSIVSVEDAELGAIKMQNVTPRLSRTPGRVRHAGLPLGAANEEVYAAIGISSEELAALKAEGVV
jgi:formyl-CoA transferase